MSNVLFHIVVGAIVMTALWSVLAWMLVTLFRLHSPVGRFIVFLVPLVAAFVARVRLSPGLTTEIAIVCVSVALVFLGRDVLQYLFLKKHLETEAESSEYLQAIVNELAQPLRIPSPRALVSNSSRVSPFTAGVGKPFIIMPYSLLTTLTESELRVLLTHEMAHIRRKDILWKWILRFLRHLSFLNPVASWSYGQLNLSLEQGSDRLTIAVTKKPGTLARTLMKVEKYVSLVSKQGATPIPAVISRADSYLPTRIRALGTAKVKQHALVIIMKVVFIFAIFRFICFRPVKIWLALFS